MNLLVGAVVALGRVFVDAGRVLANHWPQLVGLFLLGWAGRMGFLWLATVVSDVSPSLAVFIVPLAPMSTLVSLVLMLRATAPSPMRSRRRAPRPSSSRTPSTTRPRRSSSASRAEPEPRACTAWRP